jgi:integrase/recombinase XerD
MSNHIIRVLFMPARSRLNKGGQSVLKCRLSYRKKRKEFSTGLFINPKNWNSKQQSVEPPEPDVEILNTQLSLIKTKLSQAFFISTGQGF